MLFFSEREREREGERGKEKSTRRSGPGPSWRMGSYLTISPVEKKGGRRPRGSRHHDTETPRQKRVVFRLFLVYQTSNRFKLRQETFWS